jgi:hypothetical protein
MTDGLITRIGKWIDNKWKVKATEEDVLAVAMKQDKRMDYLAELIAKVATTARGETIFKLEAVESKLATDIHNLRESNGEMSQQIQAIEHVVGGIMETKESPEIKTRLEKLELYVGMTRKIDPTKPAVAKSAFAM